MPRSNAVMAQDIHGTLMLIDQQMKALTEQASKMGVNASELQTMDGQWPVIPLLQARASILVAEALVKNLNNIKER